MRLNLDIFINEYKTSNILLESLALQLIGIAEKFIKKNDKSITNLLDFYLYIHNNYYYLLPYLNGYIDKIYKVNFDNIYYYINGSVIFKKYYNLIYYITTPVFQKDIKYRRITYRNNYIKI